MTDKTNKRPVQLQPIGGKSRGIIGKKTDIQNPELWDFPMDYPISIIGHEGKHEQLLNEVKVILGSQFPDFDMAGLQVKPSRTGRFHSIRGRLYFSNADQVNNLYAALDKAESVRMVL